jgi:hypothetical protein
LTIDTESAPEPANTAMTNDSTAPFPDPLVTANVYGNRQLDEVIHGALAPLLRTMARHDPEGLWRLWFVRYPRRGEHLKVRLHGPEAAAPELRELLAEAVEACFEALPPVTDGEPRKEAREVPSIDQEDDDSGLHADRSLLWTHYRRSHISLGGKPLLDDDRYAALITACLARACQIVLASLRPNNDGQFSHNSRQTPLLLLVIGGLGALGFGTEKNAVYLTYHRDWLLRFAASRSNMGSEKITQTLALFDQRIERMGDTLATLRTMAFDAWSGEPRDSLDGSDGPWWQALRDFQDYLDWFRGNPDYQLDPFATDIVFSPMFKVFHGSANQLGLNMLNEAFAHHLLFKAVAT